MKIIQYLKPIPNNSPHRSTCFLVSYHHMSSEINQVPSAVEAPENKRDKKRRDLVDKVKKQSGDTFDKRDL